MKQEPKEIKEPRDWRFIIGLAIMIIVLGAMAGNFWGLVAKQAEIEREKEEQQAQIAEENALEAIYVVSDTFWDMDLFVDLETEGIFTASMPTDGIYNRKGVLNRQDILEDGDVVKIYGDGIMTRSEPAQYPGIEKVIRIRRASLEEAQKYKDLIEETMHPLD
ncbi:MAG: hypothetical protein HUJ72_09340 [Blautia sp.]|nr:hypothetical protein [Blautia sp.]